MAMRQVRARRTNFSSLCCIKFTMFVMALLCCLSIKSTKWSGFDWMMVNRALRASSWALDFGSEMRERRVSKDCSPCCCNSVSVVCCWDIWLCCCSCCCLFLLCLGWGGEMHLLLQSACECGGIEMKRGNRQNDRKNV